MIRAFVESKSQEAICRERDREAATAAAADISPPGSIDDSFRAIEKYLGSFLGWHFSTSSESTAHYSEDVKVRVISLADAVDQPAVGVITISLHEALGMTGAASDSAAEGSGGQAVLGEGTPERETSRRMAAANLIAVRKKKGLSEPSGSNQCHWYGEDATLSLRDKGTSNWGVWPSDTANPNCWSRVAAYLRFTMASYVGIQEMKVTVGQSVREVEDVPRPQRGRWLWADVWW